MTGVLHKGNGWIQGGSLGSDEPHALKGRIFFEAILVGRGEFGEVNHLGRMT